MSDLEKTVGIEVEDSHGREKERREVNKGLEFTQEEVSVLKKALRKIDIRVLPIMYLMYLAGAMDRYNMGAALINGIIEKLDLTSTDQGNINSLFFTTYIAMEPFANVILKKTRPSFWFPFIGISWSITCMCMAAVTNATQAVIIRLLLGIFEAGFTPGMITYLAYWYTREDLGSRMSIMFSAHPGSGIVNLLYGAFASIKIGKLIAYQSIFIFGGTITLVIAIAAIFIIQDYPEHVKFLTEKEKALVVKRINASQGSAERSHVTFKSILETILDWKVWAFAILNLSRTASLLILGLIGPTIIKSFGFSRSEATFLFAVVSAIGTCSTITFAFVFQKVPYWIRIVGADIITAAFFAVVAFSTNNVVRLVFMFALGIPVYAIFPIATSWMSVNAGSTQKRALMSAVFAMVGNVVGLAVPYLFTTATAPKYIAGYSLAFGLYALSIVVALTLAFALNKANKQREAHPQDVSHLTPEEQRAMHDFHPSFRYIL